MFCGTRKHQHIFYFIRFKIKCDRPIVCYSTTSHNKEVIDDRDHYTNSIAILHEVVLVWGRRVRYGIVLHLRLLRLELCTTPETFSGCKCSEIDRFSATTRTDKWVGEEEYYNPPLLERHCTLGCWDLSPCGFSRLLCGRCSTSTFHNRTWIYLLWVIFNNFDFLSHHANFLSKKRSVKYIWTPRSRKFASSPWKQTAEYVQRVLGKT